jgi:5,10-methylenetetrahydromethanopterin reductase
MTKFSLRLNNDIPVAELVSIARQAEAAGFDQIWFSNDLFLRSAAVMAGVVAANTSSIQFGIGIMNPFSMHPSELAMLASTAQEASNGRFSLGLGAGAGEFLEWAGIPRPKPLTTTRESFLAIKALVQGRRPSEFDNRWSNEGYLRFPVDVPVYIGAMSPRMMELIGEIADGGLPLLYPPEHFAEAYAQVKTGAERAGRAIEQIDVPACFWVSIDSDQSLAKSALAEKIAYYGASFAPYLLAKAGLSIESFAEIQKALREGSPSKARLLVTDQMLTLGIAGDAAEVIRRCRGIQEMGATHLSFGPPLGPSPTAAIEILGRDVIPALR